MTGQILAVVGPAGARPGNENKVLGWQTVREPSVDFHGLFARVANLGTGDPPPRHETAALVGNQDGGEKNTKAGELSEADMYRLWPILATHFGLEGGR